jgi:hypothetical protein
MDSIMDISIVKKLIPAWLRSPFLKSR